MRLMVRRRVSGVSNHWYFFVVPGLVPGIHVFRVDVSKNVDSRDAWREDALRVFCPAMTAARLGGPWKRPRKPNMSMS